MKYTTYLEEAAQLAKQQGEEYAAKQRADLAQYTASLRDAAQEEIAAKERETEADIRKKEATLAEQLDKNAVEQQIERRNIEEAIANLGLSGSGVETARKKAVGGIRTARDTAATRAHTQEVNALKTALDRYTANANASLEKQIAAKQATYENRISSNLQKLLQKANTTAATLYKSNNTIQNYQLGLGAHGEVTMENLYSEEFRSTVEQRLQDGEDPQFLIEAFRNTLQYRHIAPIRIVRFLQSLDIPESYQQYLALNIDRGMYELYWEDAAAEAALPSTPVFSKPGAERKGLYVK